MHFAIVMLRSSPIKIFALQSETPILSDARIPPLAFAPASYYANADILYAMS